MRSSFTATTGLKLARSPNAREQAFRRRMTALAALLALALLGAIAGVFTVPASPVEPAAGAFSYFPS